MPDKEPKFDFVQHYNNPEPSYLPTGYAEQEGRMMYNIKPSQYDEGFIIPEEERDEALNKHRAQQQPGSHQAANAIIGGIAKGVMTGLQDLSYIADIDNNMARLAGTEFAEENWLSTLTNQGKAYIDENLKIYREDPNKAIDLNDSGFYWSTLSSVIDSAVGFGATGAVAGMGIAKGVKALMGATGMASEALFKGLTQTGAAYLTNFGESKYMAVEGFKTGVEKGKQELFKKYQGEALTEAGNILKTTQGDFTQEQLVSKAQELLSSEEYQKNMNEDEKKLRTSIGNEMNNFMLTNKVMMVQDMFALRALGKTVGGMYQDVLPGSMFSRAIGSQGKEMAAKTWGKGILDGITESVEEGFQSVASKEFEYRGLKEVGLEDKTITTNGIDRIMDFATDESTILESAMGMFGGPIQHALVSTPLNWGQGKNDTRIWELQQKQKEANLEFFDTQSKNLVNLINERDTLIDEGKFEQAEVIDTKLLTGLAIRNFQKGSTEDLDKLVEGFSMDNPEVGEVLKTKLDGMKKDYVKLNQEYSNKPGYDENVIARIFELQQFKKTLEEQSIKTNKDFDTAYADELSKLNDLSSIQNNKVSKDLTDIDLEMTSLINIGNNLDTILTNTKKRGIDGRGSMVRALEKKRKEVDSNIVNLENKKEELLKTLDSVEQKETSLKNNNFADYENLQKLHTQKENFKLGLEFINGKLKDTVSNPTKLSDAIKEEVFNQSKKATDDVDKNSYVSQDSKSVKQDAEFTMDNKRFKVKEVDKDGNVWAYDLKKDKKWNTSSVKIKADKFNKEAKIIASVQQKEEKQSNQEAREQNQGNLHDDVEFATMGEMEEGFGSFSSADIPKGTPAGKSATKVNSKDIDKDDYKGPKVSSKDIEDDKTPSFSSKDIGAEPSFPNFDESSLSGLDSELSPGIEKAVQDFETQLAQERERLRQLEKRGDAVNDLNKAINSALEPEIPTALNEDEDNPESKNNVVNENNQSNKVEQDFKNTEPRSLAYKSAYGKLSYTSFSEEDKDRIETISDFFESPEVNKIGIVTKLEVDLNYIDESIAVLEQEKEFQDKVAKIKSAKVKLEKGQPLSDAEIAVLPIKITLLNNEGKPLEHTYNGNTFPIVVALHDTEFKFADEKAVDIIAKLKEDRKFIVDNYLNGVATKSHIINISGGSLDTLSTEEIKSNITAESVTKLVGGIENVVGNLLIGGEGTGYFKAPKEADNSLNYTSTPGGVYLKVKMADGKSFPLRLRVKSIEDREANIAYELVKLLLSKDVTYTTTLKDLSPELRKELIGDVKTNPLAVYMSPTITISELLNLIVYNGTTTLNSTGKTFLINSTSKTVKLTDIDNKGNTVEFTLEQLSQEPNKKYFNRYIKTIPHQVMLSKLNEKTYVEYLLGNGTNSTILYSTAKKSGRNLFNTPVVTFGDINQDTEVKAESEINTIESIPVKPVISESEVVQPVSTESKEEFDIFGFDVEGDIATIPTNNNNDNQKYREIQESYVPVDARELGKELDWLKRKLPNVPVEVLEDLIENVYKQGGLASGVFINNMIKLSKLMQSGTAYHEAFHAVFTIMLSKKEQARVLNAAKKKYQKEGKVLTPYELEDILADDFIEYAVNKQKLEDEGVISKNRELPLNPIARFFAKLWYNIKEIFSKRDIISSIFDRIDVGYYADKKAVRTSKNPKYRVQFEGMPDAQVRDFFKVLSMYALNSIKSDSTGLISLNDINKIDLDAALNGFYKDAANLLKDEGLTSELKNVYKENFSNLFKYILDLEKTKADKKVTWNYNSILMKGFRDYFQKEYNLQEEESELDETTATEGLNIKPSYASSDKDGASTSVKFLFANIPRIKSISYNYDENGNAVSPRYNTQNSPYFGMPLPANFGFLWNLASKGLADTFFSNNDNKVTDALDLLLAKFDNFDGIIHEFSFIKDKVKQLTQQEKSQFHNAFTKSLKSFVTILVSEDEGEREVLLQTNTTNKNVDDLKSAWVDNFTELFSINGEWNIKKLKGLEEKFKNLNNISSNNIKGKLSLETADKFMNSLAELLEEMGLEGIDSKTIRYLVNQEKDIPELSSKLKKVFSDIYYFYKSKAQVVSIEKIVDDKNKDKKVKYDKEGIAITPIDNSSLTKLAEANMLLSETLNEQTIRDSEGEMRWIYAMSSMIEKTLSLFKTDNAFKSRLFNAVNLKGSQWLPMLDKLKLHEFMDFKKTDANNPEGKTNFDMNKLDDIAVFANEILRITNFKNGKLKESAAPVVRTLTQADKPRTLMIEGVPFFDVKPENTDITLNKDGEVVVTNAQTINTFIGYLRTELAEMDLAWQQLFSNDDKKMISDKEWILNYHYKMKKGKKYLRNEVIGYDKKGEKILVVDNLPEGALVGNVFTSSLFPEISANNYNKDGIKELGLFDSTTGEPKIISKDLILSDGTAYNGTDRNIAVYVQKELNKYLNKSITDFKENSQLMTFFAKGSKIEHAAKLNATDKFETSTVSYNSKVTESGYYNRNINKEVYDYYYKLNKGDRELTNLHILANLAINGAIANIETTNLFTGSTKFYKDLGDFMKRVPQIISSGETQRIYKDKTRSYANKGGEWAVRPNFGAIVINSLVRPSEHLEKIKSNLAEQGIVGKEADEVLKALKGVDETDAQGECTIHRYRELLDGYGEWSDKNEIAYQNILAGKPITDNGGELHIVPLKQVHFSTYFRNGVNKPMYLKYSLFPLIPSVVKDTPLESLLNQIEAYNATKGADEMTIDEVIHDSGNKDGTEHIHDVWNDNGTINENIEFYPLTLDNRFAVRQQKTPIKEGNRLVASQPGKILLGDIELDSNVYELDKSLSTGREVLSEVHNTVSELSNRGKEGLEEELDYTEGYGADKAKLDEVIIKQESKKKGSESFVASLKLGLPYDAMLGFYKKVGYSLLSLVNKRSVKLEQPGAAVIQVSVAGIEQIGDKAYSDSDKAGMLSKTVWLKGNKPEPPMFYTSEEGNTLYFGIEGNTKDEEGNYYTKDSVGVRPRVKPGGVLMSIGYIKKLIPDFKDMTLGEIKAALTPEALRMFGYRIPNQALASNDILELVGILPDESADMIMSYAEITAKTGSDFDIDKMYLILPNLKWNKSTGKLERIKFLNNSNSSVEERYNNFIQPIIGKDKVVRQLQGIRNEIAEIQNINARQLVLTLKLKELEIDGINLNIKTLEDLDTAINEARKEVKVPTLAEFKTWSVYKQNTLEALQNRRLELYESILGNANTYPRLIKSIDNPRLKDSAKKLRKLKGIKHDTKGLDFFGMNNQISEKFKMVLAKAGVGMQANHNTHHMLAQHLVDDEGRPLRLKFNLGQGKKANIDGQEVTVFNNIKSTDDKYISDLLSMLLNAFVDLVKDPFISDINVNTATLPVYNLLARAGVSMDWINAFMSQPILVELVANHNILEGDLTYIFKDAEGNRINAVKQTFNKYFPNKNFNETITKDETMPYLGDISIKMLEDNLAKGESSSDALNLEVFKNFIKLREVAKDLQKLTIGGKADTDGAGKQLLSSLKSQAIREYLKESKYLDGTEVFYNSNKSYIATMYNNSVEFSQDILQKKFIALTNTAKGFLSQFLADTGRKLHTESDVDSAEGLMDNLRSYMYSKPNFKFVYTPEDITSLFFGNLTMVDQLKQIKNLAKKDDKFAYLKDNLFLKAVHYSKDLGKDKPRFITTNNMQYLADKDKELIVNAFDDLLNDSNEKVSNFAKRLVKYAYYTSGFNFNANSIYQYISPEYLNIDHKIGENVNNELNRLEGEAPEYGYFMSQFYRHEWGNGKVVPKAYSKAISEFKLNGNAISNSIALKINTNEMDNIVVGKVGEEVQYRPFIRHVIKPKNNMFTGYPEGKYEDNLYVLAGTIKDTQTGIESPIYVRTNKFGYKNKGKHIKEYEFNTNKIESILPENNINQEDRNKINTLVESLNKLPTFAVRNKIEPLSIDVNIEAVEEEGFINTTTASINEINSTMNGLSDKEKALSNQDQKQVNEIFNDGGKPKILIASETSDPVFHVQKLKEAAKRGDYDKIGAMYLITKHDGLPFRELVQLGRTNGTVIPKFYHFSITTLGGTKYEPGVMKYNDLLDRIEGLLKDSTMPVDKNGNKLFRPELITIRIDPIIPDVTNMIEVEEVIKRASLMGIKQIKFSVMDSYSTSKNDRFIVSKMKELGYDFAAYTTHDNIKFSAKQTIIDSIALKMKEISDKYGINQLSSCAEKINVKGVQKLACLNVQSINKAMGRTDVTNVVGNQRMDCSCYGNKIDALRYNDKCASSCVYCYAGHNQDETLRYYNPDGTIKDNIFTKVIMTKPGVVEGSVKEDIKPVSINTTTKIVEGDIWTSGGVPIITTNLGGVHGAGLANQAYKKGYLVYKSQGEFGDRGKVISFPVKKVWSDKTDINLLNDSANKLIDLANNNPIKQYSLPLIGLGHGEGSIQEIVPVIKRILDSTTNVKLVLPTETIDRGKQGTARTDNSLSMVKQIKDMLQPNPEANLKQSDVNELKNYPKSKKDIIDNFEFYSEALGDLKVKDIEKANEQTLAEIITSICKFNKQK